MLAQIKYNTWKSSIVGHTTNICLAINKSIANVFINESFCTVIMSDTVLKYEKLFFAQKFFRIIYVLICVRKIIIQKLYAKRKIPF